jgi:pimeloyl-ACP methyl ester carboxylesterase
MDFNARRVRVNGLELNVIIEGEGPDVLLVHGFPDDHAVWRKQIPALVAAGYRVIAPDTRGCGDSDLPSRVGDYRVDLLVSDLVGLLDALGIEKVRLVAHDWGAVQGWHFAIGHPERVERYIALSVGHPAAYARGGLEQKLRGYYAVLIQFRHLIEFLVTRFNWWPFRLFAGYPEEFASWIARLSRPGRLTAGFNYYRANLQLLFGQKGEHVKVPVVGIWSSRDRFLVERQMTNSAQYCDAGWTYVRLDGPNHWLQLASPDTVNSLLLQHLA